MSAEPHVRRLAYLDGLRAIAVVAVIFYHCVCFGAWSVVPLAAPFRLDLVWLGVTFAAKGSHGVDLFFVISGFCLAYPTIARLATDGRTTFETAPFFAKRISRIVPPFYAALALTTIGVDLATRYGLRVRDVDVRGTGPLDVLRQALFLDRGTHLTNGSFWTLFFEARWYLAFPLLLTLYVRRRRAFFVLLAALVVAYDFTTLHAVDVAVLPAFMLGIVAADWHVNGSPIGRRLYLALLLSFDAALVLEPYASLPASDGTAEVLTFAAQGNVGWQLTAFFLVVAAGRCVWLGRALSFRPLTAIGTASYAIYLVHQPLVTYWEESAPRSGPAAIAGSFALALGGGAVFYLLVERPFLDARFRAATTAPLAALVRRASVAGGFGTAIDFERRRPSA